MKLSGEHVIETKSCDISYNFYHLTHRMATRGRALPSRGRARSRGLRLVRGETELDVRPRYVEY